MDGWGARPLRWLSVLVIEFGTGDRETKIKLSEKSNRIPIIDNLGGYEGAALSVGSMCLWSSFTKMRCVSLFCSWSSWFLSFGQLRKKVLNVDLELSFQIFAWDSPVTHFPGIIHKHFGTMCADPSVLVCFRAWCPWALTSHVHHERSNVELVCLADILTSHVVPCALLAEDTSVDLMDSSIHWPSYLECTKETECSGEEISVTSKLFLRTQNTGEVIFCRQVLDFCFWRECITHESLWRKKYYSACPFNFSPVAYFCEKKYR